MNRACVLCILVLTWQSVVSAETVSSKPNILFIVIESLRADRVGCYGYKRATTPTLDTLAAEGVRFEQAIVAASWTTPSVMTMFTSVPPPIHNVGNYTRQLPEGLTTLAKELQRAGYQTAGITSTPATTAKLGFGRGFDFYDDYTITLDTDPGGLLLNGESHSVLNKLTSPEINRLASRWLDGQWDRKKPFFLHLFYFDPHHDYTPSEPYDTMFTDPKYDGNQKGENILALKDGKGVSAADKAHIVALQDGEIRYTDEHIKQLLDELRTQKLLDNTVVVIVGDHGEEFWEHGSVAHGFTLYDELLRIPLILRYPAVIKAGTVVKTPVGHIDIMPTLLELAGLPLPPQCMGRSLKPLLDGMGTLFPDRPTISETEIGSHLRSIRTPTRKIIENVNTKTISMYDLSKDPGEHNDLSKTDQAKEFQELQKKYDEWNQFVLSRVSQTKTAEKQPEIDPRLMRQLKSMGYVK